jgi:hypothetical protein
MGPAFRPLDLGLLIAEYRGAETGGFDFEPALLALAYPPLSFP